MGQGCCSKRNGAVPSTLVQVVPSTQASGKIIAHPPTIGPIVGISGKPNVLRLWGRGCESTSTSNQALECTAACCCIYKGGIDGEHRKVWKKGPIKLQRMKEEDDWTAVVDLEVPDEFIKASRVVSYLFGVIYHPPGVTLDPSLVSFGDFSTKPYVTRLFALGEKKVLPVSKKEEEPTRILFGSCKYVFKKNCDWFEYMFPMQHFDEGADAMFGYMSQLSRRRLYDLLLLGGDQIYIDDLADAFFKGDELEDYYGAYQVSFSTVEQRKLMTKLPTMMTWDDHEIWNNFAADELDSNEDKRKRYAAAEKAYQVYQQCHSPAAGQNKKWYSTCLGENVTVFCSDNRSDRRNDTKVIFGQEQLTAIKNWLKTASSTSVKLFFVTVPMAPDFTGTDLKGKFDGMVDSVVETVTGKFGNKSTDRWDFYADQRREILSFILENHIQRVVILSGDLHFAYSCTLTCPTDPSFKVVQLVSSAFFPVMGLDQATQSGETMVPNPLVKLGNGGVINHDGEKMSYYNASNFGSVEISPSGDTLTFELYGEDGQLVKDQTKQWKWTEVEQM